jgi:undecaprenyl-diphosphatase
LVSLFESIVLGIIQGLTEWLPVSSSGHLVMAQEFFGLDVPLVFDVMLHVGTLIVVVTVFRNDILRILEALFKTGFDTDDGRMGFFIFVGSIPIAIIGFLFHDIIESFFSSLVVVGFSLLITGTVLFLSEKKMGNKKVGFLDSLLVGFAQAIALIPGISRSGLTVSAGLLRKINKETAFNFSFLLSIPAVFGATLFELKDMIKGNFDVLPFLVGVLISMIMGYTSLKLLRKIVLDERMHLFAYYCWIVGMVILLSILFK